MDRYTYRDLIRTYSASVANGTADNDLTPRVRRMTSVMLNLASNAGAAAATYPPDDISRDATLRYLSNVLWDAGAGALIHAAAPRSDDDYSAAQERAVTILRGI